MSRSSREQRQKFRRRSQSVTKPQVGLELVPRGSGQNAPAENFTVAILENRQPFRRDRCAIAQDIREGSRNELEPRLLSLSADASELLRQYYENTEIEQAHDGQLAHVRPYASKSAEQAARIAGVLTLWDDLNAVEVKANTMALGITLAQFYLSEASRLADAAVVSMEVERAEMLRVWLLDKWHEPEILPREILQYGPSSLRESPKMKAAMSLLIEHGWLARMPEGTLVRGSNRKEVYQIVKSQNVV